MEYTQDDPEILKEVCKGLSLKLKEARRAQSLKFRGGDAEQPQEDVEQEDDGNEDPDILREVCKVLSAKLERKEAELREALSKSAADEKRISKLERKLVEALKAQVVALRGDPTT